jgi:CRISPR-associated protein Cas1
LERGGASAIHAMASLVGSGDPKNVEARAARHYWANLWENFRRDDEVDKRNKLLNYGYAVMRAGIARSLVVAGLIPALGLMHASATNAFNLADDLIEPFRPFIDVLAYTTITNSNESSDQLTLEDRQKMVSILLEEAQSNSETVSLLVAAERTIESLVRVIEDGTPNSLVLPTFTK